MEELPRAELGPVLCTALLALSEEERQAYYDKQVEIPAGIPEREPSVNRT